MKHILLAACAVAILSGCGSQGKQAAPTGNPFLSEYTTPFHHIVNFPSGFDLLPVVKFTLLPGSEVQEIPCRLM